MNQPMTYSMLTSIDPRVPKGTVVVESDTGRAKKGDGWTHYNNLPYLGEGTDGATDGGGDVGVSQEQFDALAAQVATITSSVNTKQASSTAATDSELTAATNALNDSIAGLSVALAAKQNAATAATDSEVAAAVATINTTLSGKQDAATAATDAEVAAAVATINSSLAGKQDAASAATDAELAAAQATLNSSISDLATLVASKQDTSAASSALAAAVASLNAAIALKADSTTVAGNTTNIAANTAALATKVDVTGDKGREINSATVNAGFTPSDATEQNVPGCQVMVPANSGNVELLVPTGVYASATTGTNANTVAQAVRLYIRDEANTLIAYSPWTYFGTGASQQLSNVMPLGALVPNNGADKTYRVTVQISKLGTLGATGQIISGSIFGPLQLRATAR